MLSHHVVEEMFYFFQLGGVDLILGVTWLASLGEVQVNWKTLAMSFSEKGDKVQIKGDPTLKKRVISPEALLKEIKIEAITLTWELGRTELEKKEGLEEKLTQNNR